VEQQRREYHALFGADAGDALIEQEYWCSFTATVLGAYWGRELEAAEREGRITCLDVDHGHPVHTAWDIGIDDPMAIWCFQVGPGILNIVDYYESNGHGFDHYCAWLGERGYHGTDWVPHDARLREVGAPGGRTRIETMVSLGRKPLLVPDHKLMDGINAARRTLPVARFDAVRCAKGLDALREYRAAWDSGARTFKQAPLHNWASHGADAWRHLSVAWRYPTPPADPGAPSTSGNDALTVDALLASAGLRKTRV
jgi:phage terminase large subunit